MKRFVWPRERAQIERFFDRGSSTPPGVGDAVDKIIGAVRREGDRAVARYTRRFDKADIKPGRFEISSRALEKAWEETPAKLRGALRLAKRRIEAFHRRQRLRGWRGMLPRAMQNTAAVVPEG